MGDYNAIVGEENSDSYIGKYGLGKKNDRGSMLREFANNNKVVTLYSSNQSEGSGHERAQEVNVTNWITL